MYSSPRERVNQILREVAAEKAFQFYTDIGAPLPLHARSLEDFLNIAKTVDVKSIEFHSTRGDFGNWIHMLGDEILARQLANLRKKNLTGEVLRTRLLLLLRLRHGMLRKLASTLSNV